MLFVRLILPHRDETVFPPSASTPGGKFVASLRFFDLFEEALVKALRRFVRTACRMAAISAISLSWGEAPSTTANPRCSSDTPRVSWVLLEPPLGPSRGPGGFPTLRKAAVDVTVEIACSSSAVLVKTSRFFPRSRHARLVRVDASRLNTRTSIDCALQRRRAAGASVRGLSESLFFAEMAADRLFRSIGLRPSRDLADQMGRPWRALQRRC